MVHYQFRRPNEAEQSSGMTHWALNQGVLTKPNMRGPQTRPKGIFFQVPEPNRKCIRRNSTHGVLTSLKCESKCLKPTISE